MFNKIKQKLANEKITKVLYYSMLSVLLLLIILNVQLDNMDEIWNFSHAKNIALGLIPYKDISIIVTPVSMYINSLFLRINSSLMAFRILYLMYYVVLIYLLDKLCDLLKIKKLVKYVFIFFTSIVLVRKCYLDYNFMQFILIILLIYLSLKNEKYDNRKLNIIVPLLSGIAILNKQSTGLVIAFIHIMLMLFNKFYFKKEISYIFIIKQIILIIIPVLLFLCYLLFLGIWDNFYDLAIVGLTTFSNNFLDLQLLFSLIVFYLAMFILLLINKTNYNLWVIFLYSLASLSVVVPIVDIVHATLAVIIPILFLVLLGSNRLRDFSASYIYLLIFVFLFLIINNTNAYFKANKIDNGIYKYMPVNVELEMIIDRVSNYISINKDVYILDYSSTMFDLNVKKYNKYFDLFMNGNFGVKGKEEIFDIIDNGHNKYLINNVIKNWQTPDDIINRVKENYEICDSVANFDVYCKKQEE